MFHGEHRGFPKWERSGSTADLFCKSLARDDQAEGNVWPISEHEQLRGPGPMENFP